jgi:hypothetical protein
MAERKSTLGERVASVETALDLVLDEVRALKRAIWGAALTFAVGVTILLFKTSTLGGGGVSAFRDALPF